MLDKQKGKIVVSEKTLVKFSTILHLCMCDSAHFTRWAHQELEFGAGICDSAVLKSERVLRSQKIPVKDWTTMVWVPA